MKVLQKAIAMNIEEQDWTYPKISVEIKYMFDGCDIVMRCICETVRTQPLKKIYPYSQYEILIDSPCVDLIHIRVLGVNGYAQIDDFDNGMTVYQTPSNEKQKYFIHLYADFINQHIRTDFPYLLTMAWMV